MGGMRGSRLCTEAGWICGEKEEEEEERSLKKASGTVVFVAVQPELGAEQRSNRVQHQRFKDLQVQEEAPGGPRKAGRML